MVEAMRALGRILVNRVADLGSACVLFDTKVIDGAVDGAGWFVRALSKLFLWWDRWVIDGLVDFAGRFTRSLSHPIRMLQGGVVSTYALFILLGVTLLLAYYGHSMYSLVRGLR